MTREEIKKALENGESVWLVDEEENKIEELHFYKNNMYNFDKNDLFINKFWIYEFRKLFKTKAEAEHYLHHANVERIEQLPFLTWEEFKSGKNITFKAQDGHEFLLKAKQESIYLWWLETNNIWASWDLTEANFYKAYDECVRLFRDGD